jgi:FkbH-like protein
MDATQPPDKPGVPTLTEVSPALFAQHNGPSYRTPSDLAVTPDPGLRFLVVGACLAETFPYFASTINSGYRGDFLLLNNFDPLPPMPATQAAHYDFQVIHIPLRSILGNAYFQLPDDPARHEEFLVQTQDYLARYLSNALRLNTDHKLLTFVLGFMVPQQNPLGRLQPRYDLRNVMHFIERLNMFLASEVARHENAHFVDVDQVSSGIGKKTCQDDMVWSFTHGTTLSDGDHDHDLGRMEAPASMQHHYSARWLEFIEAVMREVFAMHRSIRQQDPVKLVAVDLDDTLWRGVAAEGTLGVMEGWPMGFIETLLYLKKRGILLAIVSKNDEQFIVSNFNRMVGGQISLSDFAARRINFRSKAENLAEILAEVNLLPQHAVLVDDNPVERSAVQQGLPGVRVLGSQLYYLKRILLWSPETQSGAITRESARRTEMVQAQLHRDSARKRLSHAEFLQTLGLRVTISALETTRDVHMGRALELFNKTNQFNTTGTRYTLEQCHQRLLTGWGLHVIEAEDRFTQYGLVGAAWSRNACIEHMVMSCRALGLGIEDTFIAHTADCLARDGFTAMQGRLQPTEANFACRQLFSRNGFTSELANGVLWSRTLDPLPATPHHVTLATTPPKGATAPEPLVAAGR